MYTGHPTVNKGSIYESLQSRPSSVSLPVPDLGNLSPPTKSFRDFVHVLSYGSELEEDIVSVFYVNLRRRS